MYYKHEYPVLEFDEDREAVINPFSIRDNYEQLPSEKLIITFFKEVIQSLLKEEKIYPFLTITGENDITLYKFKDADIFIKHGSIGAPACAGFLEDLYGLGIRKVLFCGGGGVLDSSFDPGKILLVQGAIRDEGFSYHYVKPARVIYAQEDVLKIMEEHLSEKAIPFEKGIVWTTDGFYRETKERVRLRREEGAKIVEMEQAGLLAVAQFRNIRYGAFVYGGDDVSKEAWDKRLWRGEKGVRYQLVELCKEILEKL